MVSKKTGKRGDKPTRGNEKPPVLAEKSLNVEDEVPGTQGRKKVVSQSTKAPTPELSVNRGLDIQRENVAAYEYLCHVTEVQQWLQTVLWDMAEKIPSLHEKDATQFEQSLRDGYVLAHLARRLGGPECRSRIYKGERGSYLNVDNIILFFTFLEQVQLPSVFRFETTDLYGGKNLPKVIYCLYALSFHLSDIGLSEETVGDLVGHINFSESQISNAQNGLEKAGGQPNFSHFGGSAPRDHGAHAKSAASREMRKFIGGDGKYRLTLLDGQLKEHEVQIIMLQRRCRRFIARQEAQRDFRDTFLKVQAHARGLIARERLFDKIHSLDRVLYIFIKLQAHGRGFVTRKNFAQRKTFLSGSLDAAVKIQAQARGVLARNHITQIRSWNPIPLQAVCRGSLTRRTFESDLHVLLKTPWNRLQAAVRRKRQQDKWFEFRRLLEQISEDDRANYSDAEDIFVSVWATALQAQIRGYLVKSDHGAWRAYLSESQDWATFLQQLFRGHLVRCRLSTGPLRYLYNKKQVVRAQAVVRSWYERRQLQQLRLCSHVPLATIRAFQRILDHSDKDFDDEMRLEDLRKEFVRTVRETHRLQDYVSQLDTRIALLVKNQISAESIRATRSPSLLDRTDSLLRRVVGKEPRRSTITVTQPPLWANKIAHGGSKGHDPVHSLSTPPTFDVDNPSDLKAYEDLFSLMQLHPEYLARLLQIEKGSSEQDFLHSACMSILGYAESDAEKMILMRLVVILLCDKIRFVSQPGELLLTEDVSDQLLREYSRLMESRRKIFPALEETQARLHGLNLDSPLSTSIIDIQLSLGMPHIEPSLPKALENPILHDVYKRRLQDLRSQVSLVLDAFFASTMLSPDLAYLAQALNNQFKAQFQLTDHDAWLWVSAFLYANIFRTVFLGLPGFMSASGLTSDISRVGRENWALVEFTLFHAALGAPFEVDELCNDSLQSLSPLNHDVTLWTERFIGWIKTSVDAAEFSLDAVLPARRVIYISPREIHAVHALLKEHIDIIDPKPVIGVAAQPSSRLRHIVNSLGPTSRSRALQSSFNVISLTLTMPSSPADEDTGVLSESVLFAETKRLALIVIAVQSSGESLEDVLTKDVDESTERSWAQYRVSLGKNMGPELLASSSSPSTARSLNLSHASIVSRSSSMHSRSDDLFHLTFAQIKLRFLENIVALRKTGRVLKEDHYQALLDAIARDICNKHQRRVLRSSEIASLNESISKMQSRLKDLTDQANKFHDYIKQSISKYQRRSHRRSLIPWSIQAAHERELKRQGRFPLFSSFRYTAAHLYDHGVILSIDDLSPRQFDYVFVDIGSNNPGIFSISTKGRGFTLPGEASSTVSLQDLLELQHAGKTVLVLPAGIKASLDAFIALINRKFYV